MNAEEVWIDRDKTLLRAIDFCLQGAIFRLDLYQYAEAAVILARREWRQGDHPEWYSPEVKPMSHTAIFAWKWDWKHPDLDLDGTELAPSNVFRIIAMEWDNRIGESLENILQREEIGKRVD